MGMFKTMPITFIPIIKIIYTKENFHEKHKVFI